jgi:hypothetical protein
LAYLSVVNWLVAAGVRAALALPFHWIASM